MLFDKMMIGLLFLPLTSRLLGVPNRKIARFGSNITALQAGEADAETYNGFRRYHAACNHSDGPDGIGSTFAPSLIERLRDREAFRRVVLEGVDSGPSVMKGCAGDLPLSTISMPIFRRVPMALGLAIRQPGTLRLTTFCDDPWELRNQPFYRELASKTLPKNLMPSSAKNV